MSKLNARQANGEEQTLYEDSQRGYRDVGLETPDADAAEQHTPVGSDEHVWTRRTFADTGFDVNEADVADQDRAVELDDDDYR